MTSKEKTRRPSWWDILKFLIPLLLGGGLLLQAVQWIRQSRPPRFQVSAVNTLNNGKGYEIANNWAQGTPAPGLKFNLGVEVSPRYYGPNRGEVKVSVKGDEGQILGLESWTEFGEDSGTLFIPFDPYLLVSGVEPLNAAYRQKDGEYLYPSTELLVEIVDTSDSEQLWSDTIRIDNTPWYHFARVSVNYIWKKNVQLFIRGENLGAPSRFFLVADIYEMTNLDGWPSEPWPWIAGTVKAIEGTIGRDSSFSTSLNLPEEASPEFTFEPGKCYVITTVLAKKQPYVELPKGVGWKEWEKTGQFGDWWNTSLVCYPSG
jgi:hypothetical protein